MLRIKFRYSFNLLRIFFFISRGWFRDFRWYWLHLEKLNVSISIIKLQGDVLDLLLKILYHYIALTEKSIILGNLVFPMADCLLVLGYHLVSGSNCYLKFLYLSNVPIQLAMSDLCLTSQVDNATAL